MEFKNFFSKKEVKNIKKIDQKTSDDLNRESDIPEIHTGKKEKLSPEFVAEMEKLQRELAEYMKTAQKWIDGNKSFLNTFAQDSSLSFKFGDAFFIDLQKGEINMATEWFFERGFTPEQIMWANMHEIAHFRDLVEDPERLMENFNYIKKRAKRTGDIMLAKWKQALDMNDIKQKQYFENLSKEQKTDDKVDSITMNPLAIQSYKIHHSFYNCLDDIWVNNWVARKSARFEKDQSGGKEIERLYREKLFAGIDYSKHSRHRQFMYALLRQEMVPEKLILSQDVQHVLDTPIYVMGKLYTPQQLIEVFIKPKKGQDTLAGERYEMIKITLEPIFEKLLQMDIDEWQPEYKNQQQENHGQASKQNKERSQDNINKDKKEDKEQENEFDKDDKNKENSSEGEGQGEKQDGENTEQQKGNGDNFRNQWTPFDDEIDEYDTNTIDQIGNEDIEKFTEKQKEVKEAKEKIKQEQERVDAMTPQERQKMNQEKSDKEWAEKAAKELKFTPDQLLKMKQEYNKREQSIAPYLSDMTSLWNNLIYGRSREIKRQMSGHFKSGAEIDIQKTINEYGRITNGEFDETRIFRKITNKEIISEKPEKIRIRLVGDMSGSMDQSKRFVLQQAFTLILSSLDQFNIMLESERSVTKSKLHVETQGYVFGDREIKVKDFENTNPMTANVNVFTHLHNTIGRTYDHTALNAINDSLSQGDKEDIKKGKHNHILLLQRQVRGAHFLQ
jgi:hypothetical protein